MNCFSLAGLQQLWLSGEADDSAAFVMLMRLRDRGGDAQLGYKHTLPSAMTGLQLPSCGQGQARYMLTKLVKKQVFAPDFSPGLSHMPCLYSCTARKP